MLNKIAPDKWKHFFVGIAMGIILQSFTLFLLQDHLITATIIAFIIVVIISYGFELFSRITGMGRYDFIDAVAGVIGGLLGIGLALLVDTYLF